MSFSKVFICFSNSRKSCRNGLTVFPSNSAEEGVLNVRNSVGGTEEMLNFSLKKLGVAVP